MEKLFSRKAATAFLPVLFLLSFALPCRSAAMAEEGMAAGNTVPAAGEDGDDGFSEDFEDAFEDETDGAEIAVSDPLEPFIPAHINQLDSSFHGWVMYGN